MRNLPFLVVLLLGCGVVEEDSDAGPDAASIPPGAAQIGIGVPHDPGWIEHFGGPGDDEAFVIHVAATGVYLGGQTSSSWFSTFADPCAATGGHLGEDCADAVVLHAATGAGAQFGGSQTDSLRGLVVDGDAVYLAGKSRGPGPSYWNDGWVRRYSAAALAAPPSWSVDLATPGKVDEVLALVFSTGLLFVSGGTAGDLQPGSLGFGDEDSIAMAIAPDGNVAAVRQFGTAVFEEAMGIAADDSFVYIVGQTGGYFDDDPGANLGSTDAFLVVLDHGLALNPAGCIIQFGTSVKDVAQAVAVDADGVYLAGWTEGTMNRDLPNGATCSQDDDVHADAFVARYDRQCRHVWTRQFGTAGGDVAEAIAVDAEHIYVAGDFGGGMDHETTEATTSGYLRVYEKDGDVVGEVLFDSDDGVDHIDLARAVAVDAVDVFVAGGTDGDLGGPGASLGGRDLFLATIPKTAVIGNAAATGSGCP